MSYICLVRFAEFLPHLVDAEFFTAQEKGKEDNQTIIKLQMTDLDQLLRKLNIDEGKRGNECVFSDELDATEFTIFKPLNNVGYFSWKASGDYKSLGSIKSEDEILRYLDINGEPNRLKPVRQIETPKRFQSSHLSATRKNKFPYGETDIACIHVAVKRGVNLDEVDFCFGGSTLEMLANKDAIDPFIAQRIPGTKCILIAKKKDYEQNLSDVGFQFERHVTGVGLMDTTDFSTVEHMHTMRVGERIVLFRAEADAKDDDGSPVEVKASNPDYWGTKVMFQMISSGSSKLCHGEKSRGVLTRVTLKSLSKVSKDALEYTNVCSLQKNILQGMEAMLSQLQDDEPYRVTFSGGSLKLLPASARIFKLFPPDDIVARLIS